jgi:hypothetical protein
MPDPKRVGTHVHLPKRLVRKYTGPGKVYLAGAGHSKHASTFRGTALLPGSALLPIPTTYLSRPRGGPMTTDAVYNAFKIQLDDAIRRHAK